MPPRMGPAKIDAFEALWTREQPRIFAFAMYRTHDRDTACDIVSETFELAWSYRAELLNQHRSADDRQHHYLMAIARGRIAAYFRTRRRKITVVTFSQLFAVTPEEYTMALADDGGIEAIMQACDTAMAAALLKAALSSCTQTQRQIVQMRYGQNIPAPEVAARLGLTRKAYHERHRLLMQHLGMLLGAAEP
jgi:RNA polymerase sigma factor (sigma-70 family)